MQQNAQLQVQSSNHEPITNGWKETDIKYLLEEVQACREKGEALRAAFERAAEHTGRKYNTVRNFYYMYMKEQGESPLGQEKEPDPPTVGDGEEFSPEELETLDDAIRFVPFSEEEKWELIVTMLEAQGQGRSVRGCAMELGEGDKSMMLRFQNKYRNMLKSDRQMVNDVMASLEKEGRVYFNPYTKKIIGKAEKNSKQPIPVPEENIQSESPEQLVQRQENFVDILSGIIQDMETIQSNDLVGFFKSIQNLTRLAARQMYSRKKADEYDRLTVKYDLLLIEAEKMEKEIQEGQDREKRLEGAIAGRDLALEDAKSQILNLNARIENQKENTNRLLNMFRQLIGLNKQFLGLNPVNKVSNLNSYTSELIGCMAEYEKLIGDYE